MKLPSHLRVSDRKIHSRLFYAAQQPKRQKTKVVYVRPIKKEEDEEDKLSRLERLRLSSLSAEISIPGCSRLFHPHYCKVGKFVWLLLLLVASYCCSFVFFIQLRYYLTNPVTSNVTLVWNNTLSFPSFTVCSPIVYLSLYHLGFGNSSEDVQFRDASYRALHSHASNMAALWNDVLTFNTDSVRVFMPCDKPMAECDMSVGQLISPQINSILTLWGKCYAFTIDEVLPYRGTYSFIRILVDMDSFYNEEALQFIKEISAHAPIDKDFFNKIVYYIYPKGQEKAKHNIFYFASVGTPNTTTTIQLDFKQLNFLNTRQRRCTSMEERLLCVNECVDRLLLEQLPCRFFYIDATAGAKAKCYLFNETFMSVIDIYKQYHRLSWSSCPCPRACSSIEYTMTKSVECVQRQGTTADYSLEFLLYYVNNLHQLLNEKYDYPLANFLSEIGGISGILLGFSGLSFFEIGDFFTHHALLFLCRLLDASRQNQHRRN